MIDLADWEELPPRIFGLRTLVRGPAADLDVYNMVIREYRGEQGMVWRAGVMTGEEAGVLPERMRQVDSIDEGKRLCDEIWAAMSAFERYCSALGETDDS